MKDTTIQFHFLDKTFSAEVVPSFTEKPFYFFILFNENEIINEFGDELSIATTDGLSIVESFSSESRMHDLKESIFREIRKIPEYVNRLNA